MFRLRHFQAILPAFLFFVLVQLLHNTGTAWFGRPDSRIMERILYGVLVLIPGYFASVYAVPYFQIAPVAGPAQVRSGILSYLFPGSNPLRALGSGLVVGAVMFGVVYLGHHLYETLAHPVLPRTPSSPSAEILKEEWLKVLLLSGLLTPLMEELYYRSLLQGSLLALKTSPFLALFFQAICFGLAHDYFVAPLLGIVGLVLGTLYWKYGIVSSWTAHTVYNVLILIQSAYAEGSMQG